MNKRTALIVAIVVGILAVSGPILISLFLARQESLNEQTGRIAQLAADVLRRSDKTTDQIASAFERLQSAGAADPCSDANIRLMASIAVGSEMLQAVGHMSGDRFMCSSLGTHGEGILLGPPDYLGPRGVYVRTSVELPVIPRLELILVTDAKSGYTAIVHPALPIDVFVDDPDISVGIFNPLRQKLIVARGRFDPAWMAALGDAKAIVINDGQSLVAIQRSEKYGIAAFASVPAGTVAAGVRRFALVLVPIGVLAGAALAFAVLQVARLQMALPAVLRLALRRNEFSVAYQPLVDLRTARWAGAEALIRWRRPNGEVVRPDIFIPVAEESGLIQRVTERVVEIIARDAAGLFDRHPDFHIAVNLSSADLQSRSTVALLRRLATATNARQGNLLAEATERGFIKSDAAKAVIRDLRAGGARVAIDDFGTGYSSLSYLQTFELDILKIDKSFVDTIGTGAATSQVVVHIIEMAKSLSLEIIAEGVETEEQRLFLRDRGVQYAQGWLFAKPMSFADLVKGLQADEDLAKGA
ncbi:MAG TPA: EAL domain-containing protein [Stellaceae bacterium]|nr:EAL domain-containing protein [Stellaceae bacterium]